MKVAWITGASSGIGEALAFELADRGMAVALLARRTDRLETVMAQIQAKGGQAMAIRCDVNSEDDLKRAVEETLQKWGRIDYAVANAGFGVVGDLERITVQDYQRQMETNVIGVLKTAYAVLPALKKTGGNFSIMGSVMSYFTLPGSSPYAMSKYAVRALAESLWFEWKKVGVHVTLICPGFVQSEIRQVDNKGTHRADRTTGWTRFHMPATRAARIIANALRSNRREVQVTFHGKVFIFIGRYLPVLFRFALSQGLRGRPQLAQGKNP